VLSVASYPCSTRFSPGWSVPAGPCLPGPAEACGQVRADARGLAGREAGAGKAADGGGKARGRLASRPVPCLRQCPAPGKATRAPDRGTGINTAGKKRRRTRKIEAPNPESLNSVRLPTGKPSAKSRARVVTPGEGRETVYFCARRPTRKRHLELSRSRLTSRPDQSNCRPENTGTVK
jgi:hypothetical protein